MAALSFTQIPLTDPDFTYTPGRGAEKWHGANDVNIPVEGTNTPRTDYYRRWQWNLFENLTQGVYDWTVFDTAVREAINANQRFSFGIMTACSGCDDRVTFSGGGLASYPTYLHNLMQALPANQRDWRTNGTSESASGGDWIPNWNSEPYLSRYEALMNAIANRIATTSFTATSGPLIGQSIPYSKVIQYIDIRGYGQYGEWHQGGIVPQMSNYPTGRQATSTTLKRIIDAHKTAFPNYPLVVMIAAYDGSGNSQVPILFNPTDVGEYLLTTTNSWGKIGWRKDSYGDYASYLLTLLDNNPTVSNGVVFKTEIMERYKVALVVGEPVGGGSDYLNIEDDVLKYHNTSFGNGNFNVALTTALKNEVRAASKAAGYRLILTGGAAPNTIQQNSNFSISLDWRNIGLAPVYENWNVTFELRAGLTVLWTGNSSKQLKLYLPSGSSSTTTDNFTLPNIATGSNYSLYLKITDPLGYRQPLPLAITGRLTDGSYQLLTNISVTAGSATPTFSMPIFGAKTVI